MGDRTSCILYMTGVVKNPADWSRLVEALIEAGCDLTQNEKKKLKTVPKGPCTQDGFYFHDVNHAQLDTDLQQVLTDLKISYVWFWDAGDCYGPGVIVEDARDGFYGEEDIYEGQYFLLLSEYNDAARLAHLQDMERREKEIGKGGLYAFSSAHEILAFLEKTPDMQHFGGA